MCVRHHSGKFATIRESNHGSGVCKAALRVVICTKKLHFVSRNWSMESNYPKSLISRINEVYFFTIKYLYSFI